jgi:hypothetical protein
MAGILHKYFFVVRYRCVRDLPCRETPLKLEVLLRPRLLSLKHVKLCELPWSKMTGEVSGSPIPRVVVAEVMGL